MRNVIYNRLSELSDKKIGEFACDCAEHVLTIYENKYPDDKRPRQTLSTARKYLKGGVTEKELFNAARVARLIYVKSCSADRFDDSDATIENTVGDAVSQAAWAVLASNPKAGNAIGGNTCFANIAADSAVFATNDHAVEIEWQTKRFLELLNSDRGANDA